MSDLIAILKSDPLAMASRTLAMRSLNDRLSTYLTDAADTRVFGALVPFVDQAPLCYWDDVTVDAALAVLEGSGPRSNAALSYWGERVNRGIENLFRLSPVAPREEPLVYTYARDLIRLATEFHPEYLRMAEHVFGNLVVLYSSIIRKGGVEKTFDLGGGVKFLRDRGFETLTTGYHDTLRNAIAHGEVIFTGLHIQYGRRVENEWLPGQFMTAFDQLCRTSNGLALALLLFAIRHREDENVVSCLPLQIQVRIAAGMVERAGLRVIGAVESETSRVGKQLHVAMETACRQRAFTMLDCARVASSLIEAGAHGYSRFAIEVDQGVSLRSLAFVLPDRLLALMNGGGGVERLEEVFGNPLLLWVNEPAWRWRLRARRLLISSAMRLYRADIQDRSHAVGLRRGNGRFHIREIENKSASGTARVDVRAALKNPGDASDHELVDEILRELVSVGRRKWVNSSPSELDRRLKWRKRPCYVWVSLYRRDGTLRWLRSGGWAGGNLVAVAEWTARKRPPIFVKNPQKVVRGLRVRYEMDAALFAKALSGMAELQSASTDSAADRAAGGPAMPGPPEHGNGDDK